MLPPGIERCSSYEAKGIDELPGEQCNALLVKSLHNNLFSKINMFCMLLYNVCTVCFGRPNLKLMVVAKRWSKWRQFWVIRLLLTIRCITDFLRKSWLLKKIIHYFLLLINASYLYGWILLIIKVFLVLCWRLNV